MLLSFNSSISHIALPEKFTNPFHYMPHPLCVMAAEELKSHLSSLEALNEELKLGKMFGVLVAQAPDGTIGYLAAFSGNLGKQNVHSIFVPPIYDLLQPDGFFKREEKNISAINARVKHLEKHWQYKKLKEMLEETFTVYQQVSTELKAIIKESKKNRDLLRQTSLSKAELKILNRQSQHQKAEQKRGERIFKKHVEELRGAIDKFEKKIEGLKEERKKRSAALQQKIFEQFRLLNYQGETKNVFEIFDQSIHRMPPAGTGECAAPKLLQYAYQEQLKPIAMAEFWWGDSPKSEIRHDGFYYPACKGKCEPILQFMLQGLDVEEDTFKQAPTNIAELEILYEDDWLVAINKPEGMLSVPGKDDIISVEQWAKEQYPACLDLMLAHRLDMSTSGVLLIAKTKAVHQDLQEQFTNRTVKKRYIALLDGTFPQNEGIISLSLCPDPLDRPRQIVSFEYGKIAATRYEVLKRIKNRTRVALYPLTGRTHQLRVHTSHPNGLHCPIVGDPLYGKEADRLYLHAEYLEFKHPVSGEIIQIEKKAPF